MGICNRNDFRTLLINECIKSSSSKMFFLFVFCSIVGGNIIATTEPNGDVISYIRNVEEKVSQVNSTVNKKIDVLDEKFDNMEVSFRKDLSAISKKLDTSMRSWKLQASNVCFGAKNNGFGKFSLKTEGRITAIKLVHTSGYVSCSASWE